MSERMMPHFETLGKPDISADDESIEKKPKRTDRFEQVKTDPIGLYLEQLNTGDEFKEIQPQAADLSFMSKEQRAETLWALFQEVKGEVSGKAAHKRGETTKRQPSEFAASVGLLKALYADEEVRTTYIEASQRHLQEVESINGDWEKYEALQKQIHEAEAAVDATARKIFSSRGGNISKSESLLHETTNRQLIKNRDALSTLLNENPQLSAQAQYETLRAYSQQLQAGNGFMWLPSRLETYEKIERAALSGMPVLLAGESGTGKTELVRELAMKLTGMPMAETPGKDIRFQDLIAKRDIGADGQVMNTYYRYAEIGEAMTGKTTTLDEKPRHQGRVVLDDEFNLLPSGEQSNRLARIAGWKPGKRISVPVTNEDVVVAPNFLYVAPINPASEKYRDRAQIPPEVKRKFNPLELDYLRQTEAEPEIYEAMLASLMDENGRLWAVRTEVAPHFEDREEVETAIKSGQEVKRTVRIRELRHETMDAAGRTVPAGGFLWRFAQAIHELNESFSHRKTVLDRKGDGQYLKDIPVDIGMLLGWLKEYRGLENSQNLESFMVEKVLGRISGSAYSTEDQALVKEFLGYFGIDTSPAGRAHAAEADHQFENLTPVEVGKLSPRVRYKEVVAEEPVLTESYLISPEGERVEYRIEPYTEGKKQLTPGQVVKGKSGGELIQYRGLSKKTGDPIFVPYKAEAKKEAKRKETGPGVSLERAAEIMGRDFFGPDAVEKAFEVKLAAREVPRIPFSKEDLERAKELGQMLVLRVSKAPDGSALSMVKLNGLVKEKLKKARQGKALHDEAGWKKDEQFYTTEAPETRWALVTKEVVPGSTSKNYLEQTDVLAAYLKDKVFRGMSLPREYADAIAQYEAAKGDIGRIIDSDWQEAARRLSELKLNQLSRQMPVEAFYDVLVRLLNNGERSLEATYTWTKRRYSGGELVLVGDAASDGARVGPDRPDYRYDYLGVSFSRSL